MPTVIVFDEKNTPRIKDFVQECDQLMNIKGFQRMSARPISYFSPKPNIPQTELQSLVKMLKAITTYNQAIRSVYVGHNMRKM